MRDLRPSQNFMPRGSLGIEEIRRELTVQRVLEIAILAMLGIFSSAALAQSGTGSILGQVTDPSGAAISKATVVVTTPSGSPMNGTTGSQGNFEFKALPPGKYVLNVIADGFNTYENDDVNVTSDQATKLNASLTIAVAEQKVQVTDSAATVDVNPANNAGAVVISGKELEALPDDPDELQADLQALAGPSVGPNGGQIYIDGFTGGQLPPKASIREIRINQNPFSSEYDKLGYGRIEVFTKPGTDKYHGQLMVNGNTSAFNAPNPFVTAEPPYHSTIFSGNLSGPINKKASFFFNVERRNIDEISPINATILDPSLQNVVRVAQGLSTPKARTNINPRLDYAISKNNTLTVRYQYFRDINTNDGVGGFTLATQAYNSLSTEHTLQISDTQIFGAKVINETRFQYLRGNDSQQPQNTMPGINVLGNFNGGGSGAGTVNDHQDHYEFQNYTSVVHGSHLFKVGARVRAVRNSSDATSGFNGTFTFASLLTTAPATCPLGGVSTAPFSYQCALQQQQAVGTPHATQLSITIGSPRAAVTNVDAGLYFQDDWRIRPNITISPGIRYETQGGIYDRFDLAPRLGIAWGVGGRSGPPKVVLRGGFGMFYDRFPVGQILQAERLNGITQQQYVIPDPTCFPDPAKCDLSTAQNSSVIYKVDPGLRAPYVVQSAASAERQLSKSATLSVTYLNARGFDQLLSLSLPNSSGGHTYQYSSEGVFHQNQLIVNSNVRAGTKAQLFGFYTLNYAKGNVSGVSNFPSDSTNIDADYGRSSFDTRHRLFLGGTLGLPYSFRLSPFMVASTGSPFNVTVPNDLNGDNIYNDRPGLVSTASCPAGNPPVGSIYCTPLGTFNAIPAPGDRIVPINYATGPAHFTLNMRLTKSIGFGPKANNPNASGGMGGGPGGGRGGGGFRGPLFGGGGPPPGMAQTGADRRYSLTFGVFARNVFNHVNANNPTGVLGSPNFDRSNGILGFPFSTSSSNRRIDLQVTFGF